MNENECHPSESAIGTHLDEQTEIAALARRFYEEEGCPEGKAHEHWLRAEREFHARNTSNNLEDTQPAPTEADCQTEEAMHLAQ